MPLFIFISGMFSHIKVRNKYKLGILRIFETYICFQLIKSITTFVIDGNVTLSSVVSVIVVPCYTLWYLLSLVFGRVIVLCMPENVIKKYPMWIIITCVFISLLCGFIPVSGELSLQRTMVFLPFFFMGYYAKEVELKTYIAKIPLLLAFSVLLSVFLIYFFVLNKSIAFVFMGRKSYWHIAGISPYLLCFARGIFLFSATTMSVMVMRIVLTRPLFARLGGLTFFIYIYHSFAVEALRMAIIHGYFPQNEWMLIVLSVFITICLIFLARIKFFNILLNPVSYILKTKNNIAAC